MQSARGGAVEAEERGGARLLEAACSEQYARLLACARRMLRGREYEALDFVQQTMERFLEFFPRGPPPEPHRSLWLARTLKNLVISDWRRRAVRQRAMADPLLHLEAGPQGAASAPSASPAGMDRVTLQALQKAVTGLSPKLREAYELHMRGLSYDEIGGRLRITATAAGKRLHDARRRLRALLESPKPQGTLMSGLRPVDRAQSPRTQGTLRSGLRPAARARPAPALPGALAFAG